MYRLYVMQHQWVLMGLFFGGIIVCAMALTYTMIWTPRKKTIAESSEPAPEGESFLRWYIGFMPWILQMTFLFSILFAVLYVIVTLVTPPNW